MHRRAARALDGPAVPLALGHGLWPAAARASEAPGDPAHVTRAFKVNGKSEVVGIVPDKNGKMHGVLRSP